MAITTKDLAQLCGVSRTTIHRALNGTGRIKPETKEMILQVAKEHGYRPDLLATGLAKGQTYNIGVVVLDVKNRYFARCSRRSARRHMPAATASTLRCTAGMPGRSASS